MKNNFTTKRNAICFILCINFIAFIIYVWELRNDYTNYVPNEPFQRQHLLIVLDTLSIHYFYFYNLNNVYFNMKPSNVYVLQSNSNACSLDQESIATNRVDLTNYLDKKYKYDRKIICNLRVLRIKQK